MIPNKHWLLQSLFFSICASFLSLSDTQAQGLKLQQGYLEPVIARVNRPGKISVAIQNTESTPFYDLIVELAPPQGTVGLGASATLRTGIPLLAGGEVKLLTWDVESSVPAKGSASVVVKQGSSVKLNTTFPMWWHGAVPSTTSDYVPEPVASATGSILVGAMICPFWRDTAHSSIYLYPDRKPALGYFDEGDFEATDWQVKWALEHGISYFVSCWYRDPANVGKAVVVPEHHRWLEGGFLNGRYGSTAKFAIMSVGKIASSKEDMVGNVFSYWMENYLKRPNYLVIDNKPVIFFFEIPLEAPEMALAVSEMRAAAQLAGFDGLHVIGSYNGFKSAGANHRNQDLKDAGMDYSSAYHIPTFMGTLSSQTPSASEVIGDHQQVWDAQQLGVIPNFVTVSSGWNSEPWGNSISSTKWRLNPANYTTLLRNAKTELMSRSGNGLETKMLLLDNWDEWGEGHFIGVTREHAFGYLDAVREIFSTGSSPQVDLIPQDVGRGTPYFDGQDRGLHVLASVGGVAVGEGASSTFQVKLSRAPAGPVTVTNSVSKGQNHAVISGGETMLFTPSNWSEPQKVSVTGLVATSKKIYAFSSAGGNSGYADDWVQIIVHAAPAEPPSTGSWSVNASGSWSAPQNWLSGLVPNGDNATVNFNNFISGSRTVTVDLAPTRIRNLVFSPPGSNNWTLAGGSIQLAPDASITVTANSAMVNSTLTNMSTLVKLGGGTLVLNGANAFTGGSVVNAGTLRAGNASAFGTGAVSIKSGAGVDTNGLRLTVDVIASGSGPGGNGAIMNNSGIGAGIQNLALFGNTTISSVFSGLNIHGGIAGGGHSLTVTGNGTAGYVGIGRGESDLGDINVLSGALYVNGYLPNVRECLGRPSSTLTLSPLATLGFVRNGSITHHKTIVSNGGTIRQWDSPTSAPVLAGGITLNTTSTFDVADVFTVISSIGGSGGLLKKGGGTLALAAANDFAGPTSIESGTLQIAHPLALQSSTLNYDSGSLSFGSAVNATIGGLAGNMDLPLPNLANAAVSLGFGSNSEDTTFSGILSGPGALVKQGGGTTILTGPNTFSGGTTVQGGVLKAGSSSAFGSQTLTIVPGGTVDMNGYQMPAQNVIAAGPGFSGAGALINSSPNQARIRNLNVSGNVTLGSNQEGLNLLGTVAGGGHTLTVIGAGNGYVGIGNGSSDLGDIDVRSGSLYANGYLGNVTQSLGRSANTATIAEPGTLGFPATGTALLNKKIVLNGGRIYQFLGGSPTLQGPVLINSDSVFDVADTLSLTGAMSGAGGFRKTGLGTLALSGASSHDGSTLVQGGTLRLGASGSISQSRRIVISKEAVLDVAAHTAGYTIEAQQTLGGNGTINGKLTIKGTIAPGESVGRLEVVGDTGLCGLALMELEKVAGCWSSDLLSVKGEFEQGGELVVSVIGGGRISAGDRFKLFDAAIFKGKFEKTSLPGLRFGLAWLDRLAVDGTLTVVEDASFIRPAIWPTRSASAASDAPSWMVHDTCRNAMLRK
jgi:autotransporter-associated beta strand protein